MPILCNLGLGEFQHLPQIAIVWQLTEGDETAPIGRILTGHSTKWPSDVKAVFKMVQKAFLHIIGYEAQEGFTPCFIHKGSIN